MKPPKGKKIPKKITANYLHNAGLYYLGRFAASRANFETVMLRKIKRSCMHHKEQDFKACAQMARALADKFERSGLLNDKTYAESAVTSLRRAGKSRRAILSKLAAKGLAKELAAKTLNDFDADPMEAEMNAARAFAKKKKLSEKPPDKALAILARAGFSYDMARKALEIKEPED